MSSLHIRWVGASIVALVVARAALAQEIAPAAQDGAAAADNTADPAKKYADLRKSKNRATKALADRYADLMRVQEWTDKTGQFKTKAKYVAHDPDMKWVKLSTITGSGDNRVVKESTIQVANLSKVSQSKVRQIAALQRKLDELAAAEKTDAAGVGELATETRYGRGEMPEREGRTSAADAAAGPDAQVDPTQWATSYAAFRANFTMVTNESGEKVLDWGELQELRAASEAAANTANRPGGQADAARQGAGQSQSLGRLGEVHWEAPFVKARLVRSVGGEVEFRLPALPKPLKMRFLIEAQDSYRSWSELPANEPVQFIGRFESVKPREIVMRVRLANPPGGTAAPAAAASDRR